MTKVVGNWLNVLHTLYLLCTCLKIDIDVLEIVNIQRFEILSYSSEVIWTFFRGSDDFYLLAPKIRGCVILILEIYDADTVTVGKP